MVAPAAAVDPVGTQEGEDVAAAVDPVGTEAFEPARALARQYKKRAKLSDLPIPDGVTLGCGKCRRNRVVGGAVCLAKAYSFQEMNGSFVYRQLVQSTVVYNSSFIFRYCK